MATWFARLPYACRGSEANPASRRSVTAKPRTTAGKFVFDDVAPGRYTLSADKPGFVTAPVRRPLQYIRRHATHSHRGNGDERPGHQDDSSRRHCGQGTSIRTATRWFRCRYKRCASRMSVDGSNCGQPAVHRPMTWVSIVSLISRPGAITSAQPTTGAMQIRSRTAWARRRRTGRKYHHLLSEWSGSFQRRCGGCRRWRRNARHGHPLAPGEGLHRSRQSRGCIRSAGVGGLVAYPEGWRRLTCPSLNGGGSSQLRPDGTFEFRNILPGTYVLQLAQVISINGNPPADVTGRVEVTVGDANIDDLVLPLVPRPEITGTVTLEDGDIATLVKPAQNTPGVAVAGNAVVRSPAAWRLPSSKSKAVPAVDPPRR